MIRDFDYKSDYQDLDNRQKPSDGKVSADLVLRERTRRDAWMANIPEYPKGNFSGKGVIMVAGGPRYLTCAYVNLTMLRRTGCTLPVEIWYLGKREVDYTSRKLFDHLGDVTFRDVEDYIHTCPFRKIGGWEMNVYSIINSDFEEVFFLDADNTPLIDVEDAFDWPEYQQTGAVFWPDYGRLAPGREIWSVMGITYRDEPEFESGQIMMHKEKCWKELHLTQYLNQYSDIYYKLVHGDKETYHMAWRSLGTEYSMIPSAIRRLNGCMSQHDFHKNIILQHRNMDKWNLDPKANRKINGFLLEEECFAVLQELRKRWDGEVDQTMPHTKREMDAYLELQGTQMEYIMVDQGSGPRTITLNADGTTSGAGHVEKYWYTKEVNDDLYFMFADRSVTAVLKKEGKAWKGFWTMNELYRVMLVPEGLPKEHPDIQYKSLVREYKEVGVHTPKVLDAIEQRNVPFSPETLQLANAIKELLPDAKKVGEIGVYSPSMSLAVYYALIEKAEVFLVEPQPDKYAELKGVLQGTEHEIHPVAIGEKEGYVKLYIPTPEAAWNVDAAASAYIEGLDSPYMARTGDKLPDEKAITVICREFAGIDPGDLDACHIDVEGREWDVLRGMISRPRFLSMELYGPKGYKNPHLDKIGEWLRVNRYYPAGHYDHDRYFCLTTDAVLAANLTKTVSTSYILRGGDNEDRKVKLDILGKVSGSTDYTDWRIEAKDGSSMCLYNDKTSIVLMPVKQRLGVWTSANTEAGYVLIKG